MSDPLQDHIDRLHREAFVIDAHFDLPWDVANQRDRGRRKVVAEQYLPGFRAGGFDLIVASIYIENFFLPEMGLRKALDQIGHLLTEAEEAPGIFRICRKIDESRAAAQKGQLALLLSLEGADPLQNDPLLLRVFYELGVRVLGLAWSRRNYAADGCHFGAVDEGQPGGLTAFGVELVRRAEALGMLVDASHLNEAGFWDLMQVAQQPVIASHSNCRTLCDTPRNLTDAQIEALATKGGVMGMNAISSFVGQGADKLGAEALLNHLDHVVKLVGIDHVGLGLDFCQGFQNYLSLNKALPSYDVIAGHAEAKSITAGLIARGYDDASIHKILGGNFLRVISQTIG